DWDLSWHLMPLDLLRDHLLATLWDLHAQPPLYNLWCGVFIKLFEPHHIEAMHYPQIILGALICGMVYGCLRRLLRGRRVAFWLAFLLALNPALFLFEANLGYDLLSAFWVVLAVYCVARFQDAEDLRWLAGFILTLNLLILTRSMFHLALLVVSIPFVCVLARPRWRRMLVLALAISLLAFGWYTKNLARFGFFGASSWAGQNLWTNVSANYNREDLQRFIDDGVLDRTVLDVLVWNRPETYRPYGFDRHSDAETLARNNYNNVNVIAISRMYQRNALRLICHRPLHYAINVARAYRIYCLPTSRTKYVQRNADKIRLHEAIASQIIQGQYFTGLLGRLSGKDPFLSFWFFLIPIGVAGYAVTAWRRRVFLRDDAVMAGIALLIMYTTSVACMCDYGENGRFRFAVEPLLCVFILVLVARAWRYAAGGRVPVLEPPAEDEQARPKISVVIPTWNRKHLLAECLDSLAEQTFRDFEIIVVDDGSTDDTAAMLRDAYPGVRVVGLPENQGFCVATNAGIRETRGELVLLLNNDMTLEPDALDQLTTGADGAQLCAPLVLWRDAPETVYGAGDVQRASGRPESIGFRARLDAFQAPDAVFGVSAGAGLYRRSVFEQVGLLDERFEAYFEDSDLNFRARLAGFRARHVPQAVAYHVGSASIEGRTWWRARQCFRNHALLVVKDMPAPLLMRHAPAILREHLHQAARAFSAARSEFGALRAAVVVAHAWLSILAHVPHACAERAVIQRTTVLTAREVDALLLHRRDVSTQARRSR
ncbi:MAG TPA: glycosyltransferase, partial [Candidatus Hydrogenedentes bacterium]|nr:glycosyltransferase [Candidatus Hydrogenedentota bacterium]